MYLLKALPFNFNTYLYIFLSVCLSPIQLFMYPCVHLSIHLALVGWYVEKNKTNPPILHGEGVRVYNLDQMH